MIEGFFRMAYTGATGSGLGVLMLREGAVAGADVAGGTYDGVYDENSVAGKIEITINMTLPAGAAPVQTGIPLAAPVTTSISAILSQIDIDDEKPILLKTDLGPVNVVFKKIRTL